MHEEQQHDGEPQQEQQHDERRTSAATHEEDGQEQAVPMRRLGRGLSALLGGNDNDDAGEDQDSGAQIGTDAGEIAVELIERNPFQPRQDFAEDGIAELAESIRRHGILQAVLVRPQNGGFQLIAGERRLIAAKRAELTTIPCRVLELEDKQVCAVAIEENLKRKDLNVLEKAQAFQEYLDRFESSVEELAEVLGLNRSTVTNVIRLLELADPVKKSLREEKISAGAARAMLTLEQNDQAALCKEAVKEGLSVRAVETRVRELQGRATVPFPEQDDAPQAAGEPTPEADPHTTNHVLSIAQQLRDQLGAKVDIKMRGKDKGRIVIDFDSNEEFERIVQYLREAA